MEPDGLGGRMGLPRLRSDGNRTINRVGLDVTERGGLVTILTVPSDEDSYIDP
jgi:hypothetical protein